MLFLQFKSSPKNWHTLLSIQIAVLKLVLIRACQSFAFLGMGGPSLTKFKLIFCFLGGKMVSCKNSLSKIFKGSTNLIVRISCIIGMVSFPYHIGIFPCKRPMIFKRNRMRWIPRVGLFTA